MEKSICKLCNTELKIYKICGVCGDVNYGVKCNCRSFGMNPYDGEESGYIGAEFKCKEWRIPTFSDKCEAKMDKFYTFLDRLFKPIYKLQRFFINE